MTVKRMVWLRTAAVVALCGAAGTAMAQVRVKQSLTATAHAPRARGRATLALRTGTKGDLTVVARHLAPRKSYDVIVRHVKVATLTTGASGSGRVRLSTDPRGHDALLGVDPRGDQIEVRDGQTGDDDLVGDIPNDSKDPNAGACCVSGSEHSECEDRTSAACTAAGGTPSTATSCLPDPCGSTPPPSGGAVCCISHSATGAFLDDSPEMECEDISESDCATAGGTAVQATSCDAHPCAPVPPPQVVVCCATSGNEQECEELTPEHCTALAGTPSSAAGCDPDPCPGDSGSDSTSGSDSHDGTQTGK